MMHIPQNHSQYLEQNKTKCPFYQMAPQNQNHKPAQTNHHNQISNKDHPDTTQIQIQLKDQKYKEKKKVKGGCPVMVGEKRRNPGLSYSLQQGYNEKFVSGLEYLLNKVDSQVSQSLFHQYPIFLKHTIYHFESEDIKKIRSLEIGQRYYMFEQVKEEANKLFNKGQLYESLVVFEQAISCLNWLEYRSRKQEDDDGGVVADDIQSRPDVVINDLMNQQQVDKDKNKNKNEVRKREFDKKYGIYMNAFNDQNVFYQEYYMLNNENDKQMVDSMLYQVYLSIAVCYMKLNNFLEAKQALEYAEKKNQQSCLVYFRKSQMLVYNKESSLEELEEAEKLILKAIQMKSSELIFKNRNGILEMLGIDNADQLFKEQYELVKQRIQEKKETDRQFMEGIFRRAKEIQEYEQKRVDKQYISEEKFNKQQEIQNNTVYQEQLEDYEDYLIIQNLESKYYRMIQHYMENSKYEQLKKTKIQFQKMKEVLFSMKQYYQLDCFADSQVFKQYGNCFGVDVKQYRIKVRLRKIVLQKMRDIYDKAEFNYEMFKFALEDYLQKKQKKEKEQQQTFVSKKENTRILDFKNIMIAVAMLIFLWIIYVQKTKQNSI